MTDDEPLNRDLEQMAGNPRVARAMRDGLQRLSEGAGGPAMAELARDLLAGRITLREVGHSAAYADQFREAIATYEQWRRELSPEEREELEKKAREEFRSPGDA